MSKIKTPFFTINFKAYKSGIGREAVKLAKFVDTVAKKHKAELIVAVQTADISQVSKNVKYAKVFAQHVDPVEYGKFNGWQLAEAAADNGAVGTMINHSEHRLSNIEIKGAVKAARRAGLISMVCATNSANAKKYASFRPNIISYEPPELVGSEISVSSAKPAIIKNTVQDVKSVRKIPVAAGAGVKTIADVRVALDLGCSGFLASSHVVAWPDRKVTINKLVKAMVTHHKV